MAALAGIVESIPGIAVGLGTGLFGLLHSNRMYRRGLQMFETTPFPEYQIPEPIYANRALAARMAMVGMPAEQYQQALGNIQASQAFGVENMLSRGANVGDINALIGETNRATLGLDAQSAAMRIANERMLMQANQQLASYMNQQYDVNKLQRYLMRIGMAQGLMQAGGQGFAQSLQGLGMLGATMASGGGFI